VSSVYAWDLGQNFSRQGSSGSFTIVTIFHRFKLLDILFSIYTMPATTAETLSLVTRNVSVAPLVLLSAADHFGRSAKGTRKRVVGVLLGQNDGKNVRVSNSFAGVFSHLFLESKTV
jgi:hypothetical protein